MLRLEARLPTLELGDIRRLRALINVPSTGELGLLPLSVPVTPASNCCCVASKCRRIRAFEVSRKTAVRIMSGPATMNTPSGYDSSAGSEIPMKKLTVLKYLLAEANVLPGGRCSTIDSRCSDSAAEGLQIFTPQRARSKKKGGEGDGERRGPQ